jgi:hypothetical protein
MTLPNFLIIGAAKSGTTALYRYLEQHPQVFMSPHKEPKFFAYENAVMDYRGPGDDERRNRFTVTTLDAYTRLFDGVTAQHLAIGEASTSYLALAQQAAPRIRHHLPGVKLIAMLRHPVDRAYSGYMMAVRDGRESLSFEDALAQEESRIAQHWSWGRYLTVSEYPRQLRTYLDLFPREQLRIYLYDDYRADARKLIADLFAFIGVDWAFDPDLSREHNVSGAPRNAALHRLLTGEHALRRAYRQLKRFVPRPLIDAAERLRTRNLERTPMRPDTRSRLQDHFRPQILELQDLLHRDLSSWLGPKQ